jgi:hypothetical protein
MQRIMANPHYQKLDRHQQFELRGHYYDRYVAPGYAGSKLPIPDKRTWVEGVTKHGFKPDDYYTGINSPVPQLANLLAGAEESAGSILKGSLNAGIWVGKEATLGYLGLNHFFTNASSEEVQQDTKTVTDVTKKAQRVVNKISHDTIQDAQFWMQTHPSKNMAEKAASFVGENIVQLPLYTSLGAARGAITPGNLTKAIEAGGATGKIVASALGGAADALMGSVLQGQSKEETKSNMAAFAGLSAFGEGVSIAGSALIKKFSAHVIANGGKPLMEAVTSEAEHELVTGKVNGKPASKIEDLHAAHEEDPIKTKLVTAEKTSLNSLAIQKYQKPLNQLSQKQRQAVREARASLAEDAVREMPVHMPETAKANAVAAVQETMKSDPEGAAWDLAMQKKYGINFTEELAKTEQEATAKQTGIKSSQGATKRVTASTERVNKGNEHRLTKAQEEEPRRFAQMKIDHLAYFKNPSGSASKAKFDYRKWLDGMDSPDFIKELRDHIGNQWFFEKPQHLLEYALSYRKELPSVFAGRVVKELEELDPEGDVHKWYASAIKRDKHLENMATTGRLWTEGNIFRSSKFAPGTRATKWQVQLNKEAQAIKKNEKNTLAAKMKPTQKHYPDAAKLAQSMLDKLQKEMD